jgi:hypothetical protein
MLYVITFSSRSDWLTCGEAGWQNTRVITIERITIPMRLIRICFLPFAVCHAADLSRQPSSVDRYLGSGQNRIAEGKSFSFEKSSSRLFSVQQNNLAARISI